MSKEDERFADAQAAIPALTEGRDERSGGCPPELEAALAKLQIVKPVVDEVMTIIQGWLKRGDRYDSFESIVMDVHAFRLREHVAALAKRVSELGTPLPNHTRDLSGSTRILDVEYTVVETEDAYDRNKIDALDARDFRDALEFNTELKDMFGFAWIDDEASIPLRDALHQSLDILEDGSATILGMVVHALKMLMKRHPRGFGRYYSGEDPFPRPSAEVQAEIDTEMPHALAYLRFELKEALEWEAEKKTVTVKAAGGADGQ